MQVKVYKNCRFQIDSNKREVIKCPASYKPYKTSYDEETGLYRVSLNKKSCEAM